MPPRIPPSAASLTFPSTTPTIQTHCKSCFHRAFSSTPTRSQTKLREKFWLWLRGPGENFRQPLPGSTNYLSAYDRRGSLLRSRGQEKNLRGESSREKPPEDAMTADEEALEAAATQEEQEYKLPPETLEDLRPFPLNKNFVSQSILSEELRSEIWERVQQQGKSVRQVSVEMGVDMRRVAAVVRLAEVERRMRAEGNNSPSLTPAPSRACESRAFNRTDAGRVFSGAPRLSDDVEHAIAEGEHEAWRDSKSEIIGRPGKTRPVLKPADSRIPHPHLIAFEKDKSNRNLTPLERRARHRGRLQEDEEKRQAAKERLRVEEEAKKTRIDVGRWQLVVTEVQSTRQGVGLDGRGSGKGAVGVRYGVPSQERKKGRVKIPTKVEV